MKTRTKGANGDKKTAKDLRGPNLSIDGKWRSFPKVPNLLQYVITGSSYGRVKVDGKIYRESLEVSKARFTASSSGSCPTASHRNFARSATLVQKDGHP